MIPAGGGEETMPEEEAAQTSSDVVAEAAASLRSDPTFKQASDEFAGRESAPEPSEAPEPAPEPEPVEQREGRPTEPAEAAPPDDVADDESSDDYDPEAHADYGEGEETQPPVQAAEPETPPEPERPQHWSAEDQREYDDFRAFRESQRAQKPEAPPEEAAPVPGERPNQEQLRGIIQARMNADPRVQQAVDNLEARGNTLQTNRTKLDEYGKQAQEIAGKYAQAEATLKAQQELASDADMDSEFMAPRIQKAQQNLYEISAQQSRVMIEAERLERQTLQMDAEYREGVQTINRLGMDEWNSRIQQVQEQAEYDDEYKAARGEWEEIVPRLTKEWGLDQSLTPIVQEELSRLSITASDDDLARLESWMRSQQGAVTGRFDQIRQASLRQYAEDKRGDVTQPAPPPNRASAPARDRPAPLSSKDASMLAGKNLIERLRAVR